MVPTTGLGVMDSVSMITFAGLRLYATFQIGVMKA